MAATLNYYDDNAEHVSAEYEAVDSSSVLNPIVRELPSKSSVLEVGCGSGRDAAVLLSNGFDVTATDGSPEMLRQAQNLHPELAGRTVVHRLPHEFPFEPESFDAVVALAVIMHLEADELPRAFSAIAKVLSTGGVFAYSVNTDRPGLNQKGNDENGRHFTCLPASEWERLHCAAGLETKHVQENADISGRTGIRWVTFLCRKPRNALR